MRCEAIFWLLVQFAPVIFAAPSDLSCKLIPEDKDWPVKAVWESVLPGVVARGTQDAKLKRPDYQLTVTSVEQVQHAVKFASENNIRLTVLNSGHDFLGR